MSNTSQRSSQGRDPSGVIDALEQYRKAKEDAIKKARHAEAVQGSLFVVALYATAVNNKLFDIIKDLEAQI